MRIAFTVILGCMVVALVVCAHKAHRSRKAIGVSVMHLLLALIPPIIGNLLLIISTNRALSTVGCYIYFLGMDLVMLAVAQFAGEYCSIRWPKGVPAAVAALLGLDALQLLTNIFTGHAFGMEEIAAYGAPYFRLIPYFGQTIHRVVDYGILAAVIVIFIVKIVRSPRIESERYVVILATMVVTAIWETLYIFSRTPVDRSMVGFGVFGLLVYYFSLYYRPLRLLDRLLATVASEIPDALFFFDLSGHCIWANKRGIELAGIEGGEFEAASERLIEKLGELGPPDENWSGTHLTGSGEAVESYVMERRTVTDDRGRVIVSDRPRQLRRAEAPAARDLQRHPRQPYPGLQPRGLRPAALPHRPEDDDAPSDRRRQLQADQRHLRPRGRRPDAAEGRPRHRARFSQRGLRLPRRRRRIRRPGDARIPTEL